MADVKLSLDEASVSPAPLPLAEIPKSSLAGLSFDIEPCALENLGSELVRLLKAVDSCGYNLYDGPALQRAIWRYETMWLPLLAALRSLHGGEDHQKHEDFPAAVQVNLVKEKLRGLETELGDADIVPPLDVAWVWYVHRLSVEVYLRDVSSLVGIQLAPDASVGFRYGTSNRSGKSRLWATAYHPKRVGESEMASEEEECETDGALYFPSYLQSLVNQRGKVTMRAARVGSVSPVVYKSHFAYDIAKGVEVHRGVLWLYMRNHGISREYLSKGVVRYQSFMILRAVHQGKNFEAPDDIDLIWRIHAACTSNYIRDGLIHRALGDHGQIPRDQPHSDELSLAHSDARVVRLTKPPVADLNTSLSQEVEKTWGAMFPHMGPFLVPEHVPRLRPRGKRDGYLQEVLRRKFAGSAHDSDSSSESNGSCSDGDGKRNRLKEETHKAETLDNDLRVSWSPECASIPEDTRNPEKIDISPFRMFREEPSSLAGNSIHRGPGVIVTIASPRKRKRRRSRTKDQDDLGSEQSCLNCPSLEDSDDSDIVYKEREAREESLRREEERQFRRDAFARQSHGLSSFGKGPPPVSRKQAKRFCVIGAVAAGLIIAGIAIMNNEEKNDTIGVVLFLAGLGGCMLATVALKRPDADARELRKAQAVREKGERRKDLLERKKVKEERKLEMRTLQEYSFSANEHWIIVGGGEELETFEHAESSAAACEV